MIVVLIGTRAQLIKMAPVLLALERTQAPYRLVLSGQHRVTMADLLREFGVVTVPAMLYEGDEISGIKQMVGWLLRLFYRALVSRRALFTRPSGERACLVVHGDTVSTLLGAVIGHCRGYDVVHVEAGLTSGRWSEPFPEELTRRLVFRLADVAYCPGAWAAGNMRRFRARIVDTGANTIIDAVQAALARFDTIAVEIPTGAYAVVSLHRFENIFDAARFGFIVTTLERMAARIPLAFVLHPATHKQAAKHGLLVRLEQHAGITLYPRMTYVPFLKLLNSARFVVSDGGSNQEELAWLGVPTLLMRAATERQEGLGGCVVLAHYDSAVIERFVDRVLTQPPILVARVAPSPSPAQMIAQSLVRDYAPRQATSALNGP